MVNLMAKNPFTTESVEFDTPANRVIQQLQPKNQFLVDTSLADLAFLRQLSVQGRLWYLQASTSATAANLINRVTTLGSTDFIYRMTVSSGAAGSMNLTLSNDGMNRFNAVFGGLSTSITDDSFEFSIFDSLVGDGIKSFNIGVVESDTGFITVSLFGWTENTSRIRDVAA